MVCTPAISVIIPLYNKGPYIDRALKSVLSQTFYDFEIIVVDGGSTDGGQEIVNDIRDRRIKLLYQSGKGVSSARNEGAKYSTAEFMTFLDADDEWATNHLELLKELFILYPDAGLYSTAYEWAYSEGEREKCKCYEVPTMGLIDNYFKSASRGDPPVWTSVSGLRRDKFLEFGGFSDGFQFGEDLDLWGRIALKNKVAYIDDVSGTYRLDATNRLCKRNWVDVEHPFVKSATNAIEHGEVASIIKKDLLEYLNRLKLLMVIESLKGGHRSNAISRLLDIKSNANRGMWMKLLAVAIFPRISHLYLKNMRVDKIKIH